MSKKNDTKTTTGTNRPAGKVIAEQWQKELGKRPDAKALAHLELEIKARANRVKEITATIDNEMKGGASSHDHLLDHHLNVKMHESIISELKVLLEKARDNAVKPPIRRPDKAKLCGRDSIEERNNDIYDAVEKEIAKGQYSTTGARAEIAVRFGLSDSQVAKIHQKINKEGRQ